MTRLFLFKISSDFHKMYYFIVNTHLGCEDANAGSRNVSCPRSYQGHCCSRANAMIKEIEGDLWHDEGWPFTAWKVTLYYTKGHLLSCFYINNSMLLVIWLIVKLLLMEFFLWTINRFFISVYGCFFFIFVMICICLFCCDMTFVRCKCSNMHLIHINSC